MEVRCPNCNFKIKIPVSKTIMRIGRQTTIIEFVVSDGNQPHTEKVFLNFAIKNNLATKPRPIILIQG